MLSHHPMAESTHHDRSLAELVRERHNAMAAPTKQGSMMNLSEEGHVFDHEPGMADYHHDHLHHPEEMEHIEYYAEAKYPVFLDQEPV